jgi:hypothetical protein
MTFDGVIEAAGFIKIQINPGVHLLEWNYGAPRKGESVALTIDFHAATDMASHANVLRRGVQLGGEIAGVRGVARNAVALFVGKMANRIS